MIPKKAMVDTCVLAASYDPSESGHAEARRVLDLLERRRVDAKISAVIWAQLGRGRGGTSRARSMIPLPFDRECGSALSRHLPAAVMKSFGAKGDRDRWDFDAMIYATAIANELDAIVTFDSTDFNRLRSACIGVGPFPLVLHPSAVAEPPPPEQTVMFDRSAAATG